ncbi:MAG: hypothetical protein IPI64_03350 [Chloracidobacterium sp.]|nr:hypothetical protein [Chloracidobacterium sp.]
MKPNVSDIVAVIRGFRDGHETFEQLRIDRIKNSDILIDGPILQDAFESAKFLGTAKPISGLVELRQLLSKMKK